MDLWGRIYLDHWQGKPHPHAFHRDDGKVDVAPSAASYFNAPRGTSDREVLDALTGRVLDLGCGPASYALYLQQRGLDVVAVDSSPGAIEVARERGCRDARVLDMDAVSAELGSFDAIICMGNTFGIGRAPATFPERLERLRAVLAPNGSLAVAMIDPLATDDPSHLAYHARNRAAGRPPGLTQARLEYRGAMGDWWELWMPTEPELRAAGSAARWTVTRVVPEGNSRLYELVPED